MSRDSSLLPLNPFAQASTAWYGEDGIIKSPLAITPGLSAAALDHMMREQWGAGRREGVEEAQREAESKAVEQQRDAFEQGVVGTAEVAAKQFAGISEQLDALLREPATSRRTKAFERALRNIRRRADEAHGWAFDRQKAGQE